MPNMGGAPALDVVCRNEQLRGVQMKLVHPPRVVSATISARFIRIYLNYTDARPFQTRSLSLY